MCMDHHPLWSTQALTHLNRMILTREELAGVLSEPLTLYMPPACTLLLLRTIHLERRA